MNVQDISLPDSSDRRMKSSLAGNCADPLELCRVSSSIAQHSQGKQEIATSLVIAHLIVIKCIGLLSLCQDICTNLQLISEGDASGRMKDKIRIQSAC